MAIHMALMNQHILGPHQSHVNDRPYHLNGASSFIDFELTRAMHVPNEKFKNIWSTVVTQDTCRGRIEQTVEMRRWAGAEGAILPYVGHLQLISTLKIGADYCKL